MVIEVVVTWKHMHTHFLISFLHITCAWCVRESCLHGGAGPMSIFLPDFDMGRLASRRKYILGREMLFAFSLWVVVVISCKTAAKPVWSPTKRGCNKQDALFCETPQITSRWTSCNGCYVVFMYLRRTVCLWIEDSTVFVGGLNFDTTSEGRAMHPVCVPWTCPWTVKSHSNPSKSPAREVWTAYGFVMAYEFVETVCAQGLQQHFAQVGEVIYAATFTVKGTGKPRGRDRNESWQC